MKKIFALMTALLLLFSCNKLKQYPNTNTEQVVNQLKWGLDYSSVKNILTKEYRLVYLKEIEQKNKSIKVYEFNGGKYNNIETNSWVLGFENDTLFSIMIKIFKEQPKDNEQVFKYLCDLNNKELKKENANIPDENRWYLEKDGKKMSEILISMWPENKGVGIVISRTM